jgi:hypothetical protein
MAHILEVDALTGKNYKVTLHEKGKVWSGIFESLQIFDIQEYAKTRNEHETDTSIGMYLEDGSILEWEAEEQPAIDCSKNICEFLETHKLISVAGLEAEAGVPAKTITKSIAGRREIPEKHWEQLCRILYQYGY